MKFCFLVFTRAFIFLTALAKKSNFVGDRFFELYVSLGSKKRVVGQNFISKSD